MSTPSSESFWCTADKIHNGFNFFSEKKYIHVHNSGKILDIQNTITEEIEIVHYSGILSPGFVNAHCHLELSHMKGKIEKHTGLTTFLEKVMTNNTSKVKNEEIFSVIENAFKKGIVAYGDISNTIDSFAIKNESNLHFHTFIECLGKVSEKAKQNFDYFLTILEKFKEITNPYHSSSLTIHAPYSISDELYQLVNDFEAESIISIHSQESKAETDLFHHHEGDFLNFYKKMKIPIEFSLSEGKNSLDWILSFISDSHTLLLVHNTFSEIDDWEKIAKRPNTHICLCPNANLYIENKLPDIQGMSNFIDNICIGTDSLASNDDIDILSELRAIRNIFPEVTDELLIRWATYNGAKVFGWKELGELKIGNQCHLVNISKDFKHSSLIV